MSKLLASSAFSQGKTRVEMLIPVQQVTNTPVSFSLFFTLTCSVRNMISRERERTLNVKQTIICSNKSMKWQRSVSKTLIHSTVPSVWMHSRILWRFPADTTTAWAALKTIGIKRVAKTLVTVVLSAGRTSHLGLFSTKTPCLQKWWSGLKTQDLRILHPHVTMDLDTRREKSALPKKPNHWRCVQKARIHPVRFT